ncbi:MAG: glycosyltransferase family 4 protein [Arachidicoccus sp.]|nr:glycosyltransferase family 4 protein [Arachidicoccus sp.]
MKEEKTTVITYGTIIEKSYTETQKAEYIKQLKFTFNIPISNTLLLFNGAFGYEPNDRALDLLLNEIMPLLLQRDKHFTLLICGKNIPQDYNRYQSENIIIKGFIENIDEVFKGAEIFLNPIWLGGGIKTKLVEALAFGSSAVSFRSGALGIPKNAIGEKLSIVEDKNIVQFAEEIIHQRNTLNIDTPNSFYEYFYWGNIAKKAAQKL